uniref:Zinc finger DNA binding protein n=1 Tax=Photinus pyralis TaxID=7054 RepID=A0A1Y1KYD8_PHOPY
MSKTKQESIQGMSGLSDEDTFILKITKAVADTLETKINQKLDAILEKFHIYEAQIKEANQHIDVLTKKCDQLEQYSRRNNLRVYGIPETKDEDTNLLVCQLIKEKLNVTVYPEDIDRSHRVGREISNSTRPILVKFIAYYKKSEVFNNKKLFKKTPYSVSEDLTKMRYDMLKAAKTKFGKSHVWTSDGRIMWLSNGQRKSGECISELSK